MPGTKKLSSSQILFIEKFTDTDSIHVSDPVIKRTVNVLYNKGLLVSYDGNWWSLTDSGKALLKIIIE